MSLGYTNQLDRAETHHLSVGEMGFGARKTMPKTTTCARPAPLPILRAVYYEQYWKKIVMPATNAVVHAHIDEQVKEEATAISISPA